MVSQAPSQPMMTGRSRRALRALWAASVLGGLGQSLAGSAGALLAGRVGGSDAVAGLPQALLVAGAAISALALSRLTLRRGRGTALGLGAAAAVVGCLAVVAGALVASLLLILFGSLLLGAGNTSVMLGRYAAADLAPEASRTRAMTTVLTATTIGAVAGPNLLAPTSAVAAHIGFPGLAGPYVIAAVVFAAAAVTLVRGLPAGPLSIPADADVPDPTPAEGRRLGRRGWVGLGVLSLANLVMVAVMTMAPVHLHHIGSGLTAIGLIVSLHIAGMFAPSPVSGWLTDRFGAPSAAAGAGALLAAASWLAAIAGSPPALGAAMLLLGVGWNLALVSGSTLLTAGVAARQRPRREGWGEVGMGFAAAGGGAASGPVMADGGYGQLAAAGAAVAALVLPLVWSGFLGRSARRSPSR